MASADRWPLFFSWKGPGHQAASSHPSIPPPTSTLYNGTLYNSAKQVVFLKTASEHFFWPKFGNETDGFLRLRASPYE